MGKLLNKLGLAGLVAGAAAFFLGTKQGQKMTKQAMSKTEELMHAVEARLKDAGEVTEEKFKEVSEAVVKEWHHAQKITAEEVADIKSKLGAYWEKMKSGNGHKCDHC